MSSHRKASVRLLASVMAFLLVLTSLRMPSKAAAETSANLGDFVQTIYFEDGEEKVWEADDPFHAHRGYYYNMRLAFAEKPNVLQFDDEQVLVYKIPEGLQNYSIPAGQSIKVTIEEIDEEGNKTSHEIEGNRVELVGGEIHVTFNKEDPNFTFLQEAGDVSFNLDIKAQFTETQIKFGEGQDRQVVFPEGELNVSKSNSGKVEDGKVRYTIVVSSVGENTNVKIQDAFQSEYMKITKEGFTVTSSDETHTLSPKNVELTDGGKGFTYIIDKLSDGEKVTFSYDGVVDYSKIEANQIVRSSENMNYVDVVSDQDDGKDEDGGDDEHNHSGSGVDIDNRITIDKSMTNETYQKDGRTLIKNPERIEWKIVVNKAHLAYMGGHKINDVISSSSARIMSFRTQDGVKMVVRDAAGNVVRTDELSWDKLTEQKNTEGKVVGWTYQLPETDKNFSYEVTYYTQIDMDLVHEISNISNTSSIDDDKSSSTSGGSVGPQENHEGAAIEKKGELRKEADGRYIHWTITVTIPVAGLKDAMIYDRLPRMWFQGDASQAVTYYDELIDSSIKVTGLYANETYDHQIVDNDTEDPYFSGDGKYLLFHFKNGANNGFAASNDGEKRKIVIEYDTKVNEDWVKAGMDTYLAASDHESALSKLSHMDRASLTAPNLRKSAEAAVPVMDALLLKTGKVLTGSYSTSGYKIVGGHYEDENGVKYPIFKYTIQICGDVSATKTIEDSFDTSLFRVLEDDTYYLRINAGSLNYPKEIGNTGKIKGEMVDGKYVITIEEYPTQTETYFPGYFVTYFLVPKDEQALKKISGDSVKADGNTYTNTAVFGDDSSKSEVTYHYYAIQKLLSDAPDLGNNYLGTFQILLNDVGATINNGSPLTVTDTLSSNLRYEALSLTITADGADITSSVAVNVSEDGTTVTFDKLPDGKAIVITYKVRLVQSGTYTNKAVLEQVYQTSSFSSQQTVVQKGGGLGTIYSIRVLKYAGENTQEGLAGAVFALNKVTTGTDGEEVLTPVEGKNGPVTVTTDEKGCATIKGNTKTEGWSFERDAKYALVEVKAPEGYVKSATPIYFTIVATVLNTGEYTNGDTISISNKPIIEKTSTTPGQLTVTKLAENTHQGLAGAKFVLTTDPEGLKALEGGKIYVSDANGLITISSEDSGIAAILPQTEEVALEETKTVTAEKTLYLKEIEAPQGYDPVGTSFPVLVKVTREYKWEDNVHITNTTVTLTVEGESRLSVTDPYNPRAIVSLSFKKLLNGSVPKDGSFTFELRDEAGELLDHTTNDLDGSVNFVPLTYDSHDIGKTYTYTVKEVVPANPGRVTYDTHTVKVIVTVKDDANADGVLETEVKYEGATTFENKEDTPDTGDNSRTGLYAGILAAAALVIVLLLILRHKGKTQEQQDK